jgi:hypothetical protein
MQASWLVTPAAAQRADPAAQSARRSEALLQCSMSSTEPSAVVRAWSELIGQLADRIAADAASLQATN